MPAFPEALTHGTIFGTFSAGGRAENNYFSMLAFVAGGPRLHQKDFQRSPAKSKTPEISRKRRLAKAAFVRFGALISVF